MNNKQPALFVGWLLVVFCIKQTLIKLLMNNIDEK